MNPDKRILDWYFRLKASDPARNDPDAGQVMDEMAEYLQDIGYLAESYNGR